jgi:hypothetical protein
MLQLKKEKANMEERKQREVHERASKVEQLPPSKLSLGAQLLELRRKKEEEALA